MGGGYGSVGRAVASDTRGPWFEFSHLQTFILDMYLFTINEKPKFIVFSSSQRIRPLLLLLLLLLKDNNTITKKEEDRPTNNVFKNVIKFPFCIS